MVELIKIGFITITLFDLLDIAIVTILFYWVYKTLKDTIAIQVLFGLVLIIGLSFLAEAINLRSINWLLRLLSDIWLVAFIIIFQQEIRRLVVQMTRNPFLHLFVKKTVAFNIDAIVEATIEMSNKRIGALIIFPQTQDVSISSIDAGVPVNATVSKELLLCIFNTKAPLHDGAIIINSNLEITTARCILPLSATHKVGKRLLGTRHRAGLGLTEKIDAIVLIVSEETGAISIAQGGVLEMGIPPEMLHDILRYRLSAR
ncbi:MAG: diadenylate cyclase CdaA [Ignavibacteria bacterium]|jgi:diadenylate cyclase|nr:diadenylate cyclase CdaA [Ignavibacteria bacterium]